MIPAGVLQVVKCPILDKKPQLHTLTPSVDISALRSLQQVLIHNQNSMDDTIDLKLVSPITHKKPLLTTTLAPHHWRLQTRQRSLRLYQQIGFLSCWADLEQ